MFWVNDQSDGQHDSQTYFNRFGQTRISRSTDMAGLIVNETSLYDERGRIVRSSEPYHTGQANVLYRVTEFIDDYDRVSSSWVEDQGGSQVTTPATYEYLTDDEGRWKATMTLPDGTTKTVYTDQTGKDVKVLDNDKMLEYSYFSNGQLKDVKLDGLVTTSFTYNDHGLRETMTDGNFGTVWHSYDAYDRFISQLDERENRYEFEYDSNDGRLLVKNYYENWVDGSSQPMTGQYSYEYVQSGSGINKLKRTIAPDGSVTESEYDDFGRVNARIEIIDGIEFRTESEYNSEGKLSQVSHPGDIDVDYNYDQFGFLQNMSHDGNPIWSVDEVSARGEILEYTFGNGLSTIEEQDIYGFPSAKYTSDLSIQNLEYQFNPNTTNLEWRKDVVANRKEVFGYDGLNRLETSEILDATTDLPVINSGFAMSYFENGNIESSWAGTYAYDLVKRNAVVSVSDPDFTSREYQDISYNGANNVKTIINEHSEQESFSYGADDHRNKAVLVAGGTETRVTYYAGALERRIEDGETTDILYINTPTGMTAAFVTDNAGTELNYFHTDHLGSIVAVTDDAGGIISRMNYDPWGRNRNPSDWSSYVDTDPWTDGSIPTWLSRGYTGHEHIKEQGLINMNGRLYDPALGRMLSPDNFVQSPTSSQSYNRYSYAKNNPLKYVDPDGEIVHFAVVAIVMGAIDHFSGVPGSITFTKIVGLGIGHLFGFAASQALNPKIGLELFGKRLGQLTIAAIHGGVNAARDPNTSFGQGVFSAVHGAMVTLALEKGFSAFGNSKTVSKVLKRNFVFSSVSASISAGINGTSLSKALLENLAYFASGAAVGNAIGLGEAKEYRQKDGWGPSTASIDPTYVYVYGKRPFWSYFSLDNFQTALDVAGLIPGLGEIADGLNAAIYLARGDYTNAALSAAAMVPFLGAAAIAGKYVNKSVKALNKAAKLDGKTILHASEGLTRNHGKKVEVIFKDGSISLINSSRVKRLVPNNHPNAPSGAMKLVKFDNPIPTSRGYKRLPSEGELEFLDNF